jgi:glyoxylase-like metal-dependent hydrolase (beta-lactamase superfamily II)
VDPGSGFWHDQVVQGIRRNGVDPSDISHVLLTHCHVDHARGAYLFREQGARLVAAPRAAEVFRAGGYQVWYEFPDHVVATEVDLVPDDGETLSMAGLEIEVLLTPGHTDGCVSYLVSSVHGLAVFTGDLLNDKGHPGWAGSESFSVEESIRSIEKLLNAAPDAAFYGHGIVERPACEWLHEALRLARAGKWTLHTNLHPDVLPPEDR